MRLKRTFVTAIFASVSVSGVAVADTKLTMEERTVITLPNGDAPTEETDEYTLWLGEQRSARVGGPVRMIARLDRGESYFVDEAQKTVTVMKFDGLPDSLRNAQVQKTGETRTIGSWNAERYDVTVELGPGETGTMVLWISDETGVDLDAYRGYARTVDRGQGLMTAIASLPGYPVLLESDFGIVQATSRLVAVSEEMPPPGTYEPPADYERKE